MMKKLTLKSLHVGSPRRDHDDQGIEETGEGAGTSNPPPTHHRCVQGSSSCSAHSTSHMHSRSTATERPSHNDAMGPPSDVSGDPQCEGNSGVTPKKKVKNGLFKTLRRKFTPSKKEKEVESCSPTHRSRSGRYLEEQHTMPLPRRHRQRSSHSADRALNQRSSHSHYPGSLNRPRKAHLHSLHSSQLQQQRSHDTDDEPLTPPPHASGSATTSRQRDCRDRDREQRGEQTADNLMIVKPKLVPVKGLFPFDVEYGHTSAPFNEDDENSIPHGFQGTPLRSSPPPNGAVGGATGHLSPGQPVITADNFDHFEYSSSSGESQHSIVGIVCLPPNVYDQVKDPPKESWSLSKELFKLSKFGWYWGPITRLEAEEKLVGHPDGAFLVRDSSDERYLLSLSFCSYGRTLHTRIEHSNGVFSFYAQPEGEGYSSIVDLIEHSMNDSQTGVFCYSRARTPGSPSFPVRLTKPVSRFTQVRSLQYLCRFVIRQYTRFDHIQTLPLPTSIKGWLLENQY